MSLQMVSPFLGVLSNALASPILNELGLLWGVDTELKKLTSTVTALQSVLQDAEEKQLTSKAVADWLLKLKDAAYDADDILDEWATKSGRQEQTAYYTSQVCRSPLSCFGFEHIKFRHKIAKRMKKLNQRFDDIASERSMFDLKDGDAGRRVEPYPNRMTGSIPTESTIYGRKEDKLNIVEWLLNNANSTQDLSIRSILGIGGLGKTTLAQAVFNDTRVENHFNVKIWVCVSNDFDLIKLTRAVLDSVQGGSTNSEQLDPLQRRLQERLAGKRFLLVLDDVWNENQEEWNRFKSSLECGAKGSSILVTTRLETVATITGTCPHYCLKVLSADDCWALFKQRAFGDGNEEKSDLVKIGKEIVQKCGGVPLAAKVLGGLLRFKANESEWLYIRDNRILDLPQSNDNTILPALKLSYDHLSPHLRHCFAYCSIFPQDFIMKKEKVINLWMANGLLQHRRGIWLEDIGDEIVESLMWRSLFQVKKRDVKGNIEAFVMHDLVHDLACSVASNECCNVDFHSQKANVPNGTRHLRVDVDKGASSAMLRSMHRSAPKLRTLIILNPSIVYGKNLSLSDVSSTFKYLRALNVEGVHTAIPESIGNLKHLRYLNLSPANYKYLPESICRLRNLQILKLRAWYYLKALPKGLSNLRSLRHLDISECRSLSAMPMDMGKMTCLQTLSMFIVGSYKRQYITELEKLDNLSGELTIKCLEKVRSRRDAECANLIRKKRLGTLELNWSHLDTEEKNDKEVIEGLRPDSNLRGLVISGYQGISFPSWLEYSILPNLFRIDLIGCKRCEALPPSLGRLPLLKGLSVKEMPLVKKPSFSDGFIDCDEVGHRFPSLEVLLLHDMPELEEWCSFTGKDGGGEQIFMLPRLKELTIVNNPNLARVPMSPSLETLNVTRCNEMVLGSVKNLPCLSHLRITKFNKMICFPEGSLQNLNALEYLAIIELYELKILPSETGDLSKLTTLEVSRCHELVSLPEELRNLSSLRTLSIFGCIKLSSMPQVGRSCLRKLSIEYCRSLTNLTVVMSGCQTTLWSLTIKGCPKLEWSSLEFEHLTALEYLCIGEFSEMTSLPDGIQHLSSTLQTLELEDLDSLSSLPQWTGNLTQLQRLNIIKCEKLTMLPDGLQHLTSLRTLYIASSHSELRRRCKEGKGEDWHNISHIPDLHICMIIALISSHFIFFVLY